MPVTTWFLALHRLEKCVWHGQSLLMHIVVALSMRPRVPPKSVADSSCAILLIQKVQQWRSLIMIETAPGFLHPGEEEDNHKVDFQPESVLAPPPPALLPRPFAQRVDAIHGLRGHRHACGVTCLFQSGHQRHLLSPMASFLTSRSSLTVENNNCTKCWHASSRSVLAFTPLSARAMHSVNISSLTYAARTTHLTVDHASQWWPG